MKRLAYCCLGLIAWAFIVGVTAFDVRWALRYRDTAGLWESNPVMLYVMREHGVGPAVATRVGTVVFAALLMPISPRRCQVTATLTVMMAHTYLAVTYALILWGTTMDSWSSNIRVCCRI